MPNTTIVVLSPTEVRVGGVNWGPVADFIANNPDRASEIQDALVACFAAKAAEAANARAELVANVVYQKDVLTQAEVKIPAAIASGNWQPVWELIAYANLDFVEKERLEKIAKADALAAEADRLRSEAQQ